MNETTSGFGLVDSIWSVVRRRVQERAIATTELVEETIQALGPVRRTETELIAGTRVLNGDRELLLRLSRSTGLGLCLYLGNRRISAVSHIDAGAAPPSDAYADAILVESVLRKRELFRGDIDREGRRFVVACRPLYPTLRQEDHGPVGIIEAFLEHGPMREALAAALADPDGSNLSEHSHADKLERIIHFIDDVARRLQLLALNGNIIAAQAGEHGRAFRVVCRELSSLADQSRDSVGDARKLLELLGGGDAENDRPHLP